jgi:hypothetical protein
MKAATPNNTAHQVAAGYSVLFASLAAGALALPFSLKLSLLPAALLAGWTQIGGL